MERKKIIRLFLFVLLIPVLFSCHPRHVSDIRTNMTKDEVVSLWGPTNLITHKTTNGTTFETWEYHFASSGSICSVTFLQDRVVTTECRPSESSFYPGPYYYPSYYYPFPFFYPYPYFGFGYHHFYLPHHYPIRPYRR